MTLDRDLLCRKMEQVTGDPAFCRAHVATREHLFSNVPVFLPRPALEQMQRVVRAIEATARLPAYRRKVLSWAPDIAQRDHGPVGAFMGYDFHLDGNGPRLIEINTNAGGGVLNLLLAEAQHACCKEMEALPPGAASSPRADSLIAMFRSEWRRQRGDRPLRRIAIVDEAPETQYLYPEFVLLQKLLGTAGLSAVITAPESLSVVGGVLVHEGETVDLVYNRLVDFSFERPENAALRSAYDHGLAVVTPNPHNHALFADKRNLTILSDPLELREMGVTPSDGAALGFIPRTVMVTAENAAELWSRRKTLFFKPTVAMAARPSIAATSSPVASGTTSARVAMSRRTSPPRRSASFASMGGRRRGRWTFGSTPMTAPCSSPQPVSTRDRRQTSGLRAGASRPSLRCKRRAPVSGCSRSR